MYCSVTHRCNPFTLLTEEKITPFKYFVKLKTNQAVRRMLRVFSWNSEKLILLMRGVGTLSS